MDRPRTSGRQNGPTAFPHFAASPAQVPNGVCPRIMGKGKALAVWRGFFGRYRPEQLGG